MCIIGKQFKNKGREKDFKSKDKRYFTFKEAIRLLTDFSTETIQV